MSVGVFVSLWRIWPCFVPIWVGRLLCWAMDEPGEVAGGLSGRLTDHVGIGVLTRLLHRDLVDEVLVETRRLEVRVRLLPARVVVYFVLALCLFFGESYEEVMRRLVHGLRFLGNWSDDWRVPTAGALTRAGSDSGPNRYKNCTNGWPPHWPGRVLEGRGCAVFG
jgi:hypothetical protein